MRLCTKKEEVTLASASKIVQLQDLFSFRDEELRNDAKFIDEIGKLLVESKTSTKLGAFVANFKWQYITADVMLKGESRSHSMNWMRHKQ